MVSSDATAVGRALRRAVIPTSLLLAGREAVLAIRLAVAFALAVSLAPRLCTGSRGRRARRPNAATILGSVTTAALLVVSAGCSRNAGDLENARLKAIRSDPAFALVPPGGSLIREFSEEAHTAPFSKYYLGPRVQRVYQVTGDLADARRSYTEQLPSLGWAFWKSVPLLMGEDVLFTKKFGSWQGTLTLHVSNDQQELTVLIEAPPAKSEAAVNGPKPTALWS